MECKRQHGNTLISSEAGMKGIFSACIWEALNHLRARKCFREVCTGFLFFESNQS